MYVLKLVFNHEEVCSCWYATGIWFHAVVRILSLSSRFGENCFRFGESMELAGIFPRCEAIIYLVFWLILLSELRGRFQAIREVQCQRPRGKTEFVFLIVFFHFDLFITLFYLKFLFIFIFIWRSVAFICIYGRNKFHGEGVDL